MRLRLARICRTGDVLAEHAAFRRQRPEFFDVVNRCTAVSFALFDDPQLRDAPRDKCTLSCAINGIHAAFHYLKKNYISGCVMTVPTG